MKKTCFVIIGYGVKTDYKTGREIDLDKTYRNIIEPVFADLGFVCFRASDLHHSGSIDLHMYESILKADFVVADLSTLNPNVLYELGIRHGVRKMSTLIIAEKEIEYPFDLSHILIDHYEHLGQAIDYDEVLRFKKHLTEKVNAILSDPKTDSPLYTVFPELDDLTFTPEEVEEIEENIEEEVSLSDLINEAEDAKNSKDFLKAIDLFKEAILLSNMDTFLIQRLALCTYKSKQPDETTSLFEAEKILEQLKPETTNDPETLGLSGAINKRLYECYEERKFLEKAMWQYERGFYIKRDYYNGINAAFMHTNLSTVVEDQFEAWASYGQAIKIRKKTLEICEQLVASENFDKREDKEWIYLTMAEIYFSMEDYSKEDEFLNKASEEAQGSFSLDSYNEQRSKLENLTALFKNKYNH